jgi:hypothetical protein
LPGIHSVSLSTNHRPPVDRVEAADDVPAPPEMTRCSVPWRIAMFDRDPMEDMSFQASSVYVDDILAETEDEELRCGLCATTIQDEAYMGDDEWLCLSCVKAKIERITKEAIAFAAENCRVTGKLPKYETELEWKCTPEEYDAGFKESYSPNSYEAFCRHHCTNYDELIKDLDRYALTDQIYYSMIMNRIVKLLQDEFDRAEYEDDEAEDDAADDEDE